MGQSKEISYKVRIFRKTEPPKNITIIIILIDNSATFLRVSGHFTPVFRQL